MLILSMYCVPVADAKEETQDYQLLLQSSDKELKAEKNKTKAHSSVTDEKINSLETQARIFVLRDFVVFSGTLAFV